MRWLGIVLAALLLQAADYETEVKNWRKQREERLKAPDGWLSLAGLVWLRPGENALELPKSGITRSGVVVLTENRVSFRANNGKVTLLRPDTNDFVEVDGVKLFAIHRGSRYGIRIKDDKSEYRSNFTGLDWYPVDRSWRLTAKYVPYAQPRQTSFDSQTGDKQPMTIPGDIEFTRAGKTYRLSPVLEEGQLFIVFRDRTAGKTTYPAARFLYAKLPAGAGPVELDFNKAYNPPCAFTPFSTCPLPPRENRLDIPVEAGERMYRGPGDHSYPR